VPSRKLAPVARPLALLALVTLLVGCDDGIHLRDPDGGRADAARPDAAPVDAGVEDAGPPPDDAGPPPPTGPALYPSGPRHSPIPADLATGLRVIAARGATLDDDVLMKVGDSITVSTSFLHCFAGTNVDLDGRDLTATLERFRAGDAGGSTPFDRTSLAATVGWSANAALAGSPSPLDQEHAATTPRFAVVMFGTNDVGFRTAEAFARDMWTIADLMIARGTIPLLTTIPPRDDSATADAGVPLYNLALRAIAQGLGVPFVDLHQELLPLPSHGLAGDGVHLQAFGSGSCQLTTAGLQFAANVRNLLTLEQLDRAARALESGGLDADAPRLRGTGAADDPYVVASLPFAAMGDTVTSTSDAIDTYACGTQDESGPERFYRVDITTSGRLTASVLSANGVDADVHILSGTDAASCVARDNRTISADVTPGTWYVVADTFVTSAGAEQAGEYLVAISVD
jgi:hypothetical protein